MTFASDPTALHAAVERLLALEERAKGIEHHNNPHRTATCDKCHVDQVLWNAFRNEAPALLRALRDENQRLGKELDFALSGDMPEHPIIAEGTILALEARIESLEAERDIWKERAQVEAAHDVTFYEGRMFPRQWSDPTPDEIKTKIEAKRGR